MSNRPFTWQQVVNMLSGEAAGTVLRFPASFVEHPRDGGLTATVGPPFGQRASFRCSLSDGGILCVEDFCVHYEAKLERNPPRLQAMPNVDHNDTTSAVLGLATLGAVFGLTLGKSRESVLTGALVGGVLGLAGVGIAQADRSPATSLASFNAARLLADLALASARLGNSSAPSPRPAQKPKLNGEKAIQRATRERPGRPRRGRIASRTR